MIVERYSEVVSTGPRRQGQHLFDELIADDACKEGSAKFLNRTLEERLFNPLARYMLEHRGSKNIRIEVEQGHLEPAEASPLRREEDLRGALDNGIEDEHDAEANAEDGEQEVEDYQLSRAVDLLQGLFLFRQRALN